MRRRWTQKGYDQALRIDPGLAKAYPADADVWSFRQAWAQEKCKLKAALAAGRFRFGLLTRITSADGEDERGVWTKPSHQTKQRKTEHVPLSPQALELVASILGEHDPDEPWLFPGKVPGQPLKDIKKFWSGVMRQVGLEGYRRHDNRHTYASHLVSGGLSLEIVGRLLGHTSPETTKRYAHLADDPLRRATEMFGTKLGRSNDR